MDGGSKKQFTCQKKTLEVDESRQGFIPTSTHLRQTVHHGNNI